MLLAINRRFAFSPCACAPNTACSSTVSLGAYQPTVVKPIARGYRNAVLPALSPMADLPWSPWYKVNRLLACADDPNMTRPSPRPAGQGDDVLPPTLPFQMVDGDGQVVDPAHYTATWTKLSGSGWFPWP